MASRIMDKGPEPMRERQRVSARQDWEDFLREEMQDAAFKESFEDTGRIRRAIDVLVQMRRDRRLTQTEVARRIGVGQSTVSGFEVEASDPRLSTLLRYARAVEARVQFKIDVPSECRWSVVTTSAYDKSVVPSAATARAAVAHGEVGREWHASERYLDVTKEFALGA